MKSKKPPEIDIYKPIDIKEPIVILVEGKNDEIFLNAFIKHLGIEKIQVISVGSKDNFKNSLPAVLKHINKIKCLGIIKDAEEDPLISFQSICSILTNNNLSVPSKPLELTGDNPSVIVLIIPHDKPGSLETLCLDSISNDIILKCVDQYIECLKSVNSGIDKFTEAKLDKLKLHSFLAAKKPEIRLGEAAKANFFPFNAEAFKILKIFINKMYEKCGEK